MTPFPPARLAAAALLLAGTACQPDKPNEPATQSTALKPAATQPAALPPTPAPTARPVPLGSADAARPTALDTLRLPGGQVAYLRPSTAAAFARLTGPDRLPELDANTPDQGLAQTQGRVRRQGSDLLLHPARGLLVRLRSTPEAAFQNDSASARYVYWGSLPGARQWAVKAWYWESDGLVLVDQRTGQQLALAGHPAASPDGRYVLATSPGLGGGDQINCLTLVEITPTGPRLRWQRELSHWAPERARWAGPRRVLLAQSRLDANGELPDPPRPTYAELELPAER